MKRARIAFLLFAFLILPFAAALADEPKVSEIDVRNSSIAQDSEILRVFRPKEGERFNAAEVRRSVALISAMPGVVGVEVSRSPAGEGKVALLLKVRAEPLVKAVKLTGVGFFDRDELLASFITRTDEPALRSRMEMDLAAVLSKYREEGYAAATGEIEIDTDSSNHWASVYFHFKENEPSRVTDHGDLGAAEKVGVENFLSALGVSKGSAASMPKLREGIKKALAYCHSQGYPEAHVNSFGFRKDGKRIFLDVPLDIGRKTEIRVVDKEGYSTTSLSEAMAKEYGQPLDEERVRRLGVIVREELETAGYLNAVVESEVKEVEGLRRVVIRVDRGELVTVRRVRFEGNSAIAKKELGEVVETGTRNVFTSDTFDADLLEADLSRIQQLYIAKGMLDTSVKLKDLSAPKSGRADIVIEINEGKRFTFGELSFKTDGCFPDAKAEQLADLKSGSPADPANLEKARVRLLEELSRRGYSNGTVERKTTVRPDEGKVDVLFLVNGGVPHRFGTIAVSGNARTRAKVILRELTFKTGQPWNEQEIITSRQNIFRLGFFEKVDFTPTGLPRDDGTLDLLIEVRELDAGHFDYGVGYGTEEGIKTFAEIGHANMFGGGRSSSLRFDLIGEDRIYTANYTEPWILGFPFALKLSATAKHQVLPTYVLDSYALQSSVEYDLTKHLKASLIHTLEDDVLTEVSDVAFVGDKNFVASTLSPLLVYDSRNDPFNPRRGFLHSLQYEWASRSIGSDLEYSKLTGSMSGYLSAGPFTLATLARGGAAEYYGRNELLPLNKRFFLGGRSTVRGWQKDEVGEKAPDGTPLGGDMMANLKAELRVNLFKNFALAGFWDAGYVWFRDTDEFRWQDMRQGAGPSLRYNTPVGPVSLDVGWKLDREDKESAYEWYFTIGNVF